jgi:hypothetical protein
MVESVSESLGKNLPQIELPPPPAYCDGDPQSVYDLWNKLQDQMVQAIEDYENECIYGADYISGDPDRLDDLLFDDIDEDDEDIYKRG